MTCGQTIIDLSPFAYPSFVLAVMLGLAAVVFAVGKLPPDKEPRR